MPVYGLPLSLEASLNSLVELRPPTSWRVSGHGDDVTVVLRWTLSGSPSSDKTLDYDMDRVPRSVAEVGGSHMWTRGFKRTEKHSPAAEMKTKGHGTHECRLAANVQTKTDGLQPFKLRKLDTVCQFSPPPSSPIPVFLTVAGEDLPSPSLESQTNAHQLVCGNTRESGERSSYSNQQQNNCDSQRTVTPAVHHTSQNGSPIADIEIRQVLRTYLTPCHSEVSPEIDTVTLDEKSGLFTKNQQLVDDGEDGTDHMKVCRSVLPESKQNNSDCSSESNSTSLSHYVKHTLSQDSGSEAGSHYKSEGTSRNNERSPSDHRCSSAGSSASPASLAPRSCSSKTKVESLDISSDSTNLMDEKDDDCRSQDLDMVCSNEVENGQEQVRSVSTRSSISYWDSFDSFQSDLLAGDVATSEETNRQVASDCL